MADTAISANGETTSSKTSKPDAVCRHGIARLAEDQCWYLTNLVHTAIREADHLVGDVRDKASDRLSDYDGSKGTAPLDLVEVRGILHEAYECLAVAMTYLYDAYSRMQPQSVDGRLSRVPDGSSGEEIEPPY